MLLSLLGDPPCPICPFPESRTGLDPQSPGLTPLFLTDMIRRQGVLSPCWTLRPGGQGLVCLVDCQSPGPAGCPVHRGPSKRECCKDQRLLCPPSPHHRAASVPHNGRRHLVMGHWPFIGRLEGVLGAEPRSLPSALAWSIQQGGGAEEGVLLGPLGSSRTLVSGEHRASPPEAGPQPKF